MPYAEANARSKSLDHDRLLAWIVVVTAVFRAIGNLGKAAGLRRTPDWKTMVRTVLCAAFCVLTTQACAACVKPEIPACAMVSGPFKTHAEFTVCQAKMETYRSYAETYGLCRQTELLDTLEAVTKGAQQDLDEVAHKFSWAVDQFNRRSGKDGLPAGN